MTLHPLPPFEAKDEPDWPDSAWLVVRRNFEQIAHDISDLRESDRRTLELCTEMRDQCMRIADTAALVHQENVLRNAAIGLGQPRDRLPTLPEIVAAVSSASGQHDRMDSERVRKVIEADQDAKDAKTLRRMKGNAGKAIWGAIAALLGVLATGFAGHLVGKWLEGK